jgi:cation transport ATPase
MSAEISGGVASDGRDQFSPGSRIPIDGEVANGHSFVD